ncbi:TetR/AcrR family transcriptional regulator [Streptomyces sp. NPDC000594]|uniref:TetR/AcrR family transcriptional regulator n=1 Tax=Streptomyces sp. NPDC000594 TaxID=3154261 RepID=UPI00332299CC
MTARPPARSESPRRNEATRHAILDAALELVRETGHTRLTIEGIAARARVGKQTIYRWWPSKGAVLHEALVELDAADGHGAGDLPDSGDLRADLKSALRSAVAELTDPRRSEALRVLTAEAVLDPALAADYAAVLDRPGRNPIHRRLRRAQDSGQLAPGTDLAIITDLLRAPLRHRWLHGDTPLTTAFTDTVVDITLTGSGHPLPPTPPTPR